jgi:hypothetical protein
MYNISGYGNSGSVLYNVPTSENSAELRAFGATVWELNLLGVIIAYE